MTQPDPSAAPMRVAVTGSTGLIGAALVERLRRDGHHVVRLVRRAPSAADEVRWDPETRSVDGAALDGMDAVVHLAGENVAGRWTDEKKRAIRGSRVESTRLLADALARRAHPPRVLVCASAVGFYGNRRGDELLHEGSSAGSDFLAGVVREWEEASGPATRAAIRVVNLRFGVVLSARGGALAKMLLPFRLGGGGPIGSGRQWMSWISLDDAVEVAVRAIADDTLRGPVNAVAGAATNAEFTRALARALHRPAVIPVPPLALKLVYGSEMVDGTLLASQRAEPRLLLQSGHRFHHPELPDAIRAALAQG
ncbi:MAG TPA: TIGR01777 family oxidoreductase [Longimicrobium sp.]|jgi:uncharacterized protein (TIGR01777 family)|nr:TIGR01777 family oxidoreductase [Longimicrobium sp.]